MYVKKKITTIFCLCFSVSSLFAALSNISVILIMLWRRKYVNGIWLDKIRVTRFIFVLWHLWLFSMTLAFFLFWCNFLLCFILFWLRLFQPPPFSEPSFSLSMRSWAVTLFSEYPLLFSVATPADKHVARYPDGHPPPPPGLRCMHTRTQVWTHMRAQLLHPPPGSSNSSSCFLVLAAEAAGERLMSVLWLEPTLIMLLLPRKDLSRLGWREDRWTVERW